MIQSVGWGWEGGGRGGGLYVSIGISIRTTLGKTWTPFFLESQLLFLFYALFLNVVISMSVLFHFFQYLQRYTKIIAFSTKTNEM